MRVVLAANERQWNSPTQPHRAVARGLCRLGHEVELFAPSSGRSWKRRAEVVVLWNAVKDPWAELADRARREGAGLLVMERGFFDRWNHTQIDPAGFSHTASWASRLREPAPAGGAGRFRRVWGGEPAPLAARPGYLLVLPQVPGDAQLREAEVPDPADLVAAVEAAAPAGMDLRVRPHPLAAMPPTFRRARVLEGSLSGAVAGAAFCVTVNSNAGNEALAMGCPVLCFGPATYAMAGVAMQTHLHNLAGRIAWMSEARFDPAAAADYLAHLACRQWDNDELADGGVLKERIDGATGR